MNADGGVYPAKEYCSHCGLCDTYYVAHVKDACAFLGPGEMKPPADLLALKLQEHLKQGFRQLRLAGMSRVEQLEEKVHGRARYDCPCLCM